MLIKGALISPLYILLTKKIGIKLTFFIGLFLCYMSLLTSSFVPNQHYLFFTYAIPFGLGSSIVFVLESIVVGIYFPSKHKHHISFSALISLGFPLGYLIQNTLNEYMLDYKHYDWQLVQRIYSVITLICILGACPFFTVDRADHVADICTGESNEKRSYEKHMWILSPQRVFHLTKIMWLVGLGLHSCANNAIVINLNGYFDSLGYHPDKINDVLITLGLADCLFRVLLATFGTRLRNRLMLCYIVASSLGFFLSFLWPYSTNVQFNMLFCIRKCSYYTISRKVYI